MAGMPLSLLRGVFSFDEHEFDEGAGSYVPGLGCPAAIAAWHGFVSDPWTGISWDLHCFRSKGWL